MLFSRYKLLPKTNLPPTPQPPLNSPQLFKIFLHILHPKAYFTAFVLQPPSNTPHISPLSHVSTLHKASSPTQTSSNHFSH